MDIVNSFEAIEHHDEHQEIVLEIKRILKPNGILFIVLTNYIIQIIIITKMNIIKKSFIKKSLIMRCFKNTELLSQTDLSRIIINEMNQKMTVLFSVNFLAGVSYIFSLAIIKYNPFHVEFHKMEILSFNVIDEINDNTARGNYLGGFPGLVRPLLKWK